MCCYIAVVGGARTPKLNQNVHAAGAKEAQQQFYIRSEEKGKVEKETSRGAESKNNKRSTVQIRRGRPHALGIWEYGGKAQDGAAYQLAGATAIQRESKPSCEVESRSMKIGCFWMMGRGAEERGRGEKSPTNTSRNILM